MVSYFSSLSPPPLTDHAGGRCAVQIPLLRVGRLGQGRSPLPRALLHSPGRLGHREPVDASGHHLQQGQTHQQQLRPEWPGTLCLSSPNENPLYFPFVDWLIVHSIDWLFDWVICWLIDWLFEWFVDWLIDWLIDCSIDWFVDWLVDSMRFCRVMPKKLFTWEF